MILFLKEIAIILKQVIYLATNAYSRLIMLLPIADSVL